MTKQATVRQTYILPADLVRKVDKAADISKRSRNRMVEVLLEQALQLLLEQKQPLERSLEQLEQRLNRQGEHDRRMQKYRKVEKKILAAKTDEDADQYGPELTEAIFGLQERKRKRA